MGHWAPSAAAANTSSIVHTPEIMVRVSTDAPRWHCRTYTLRRTMHHFFSDCDRLRDPGICGRTLPLVTRTPMTDIPAYHPWARPAAPANIVGFPSTVNPLQFPTPFRGGPLQNEVHANGSFDAPEDTAQTSPSVYVVKVKMTKAEFAKHNYKCNEPRSIAVQKDGKTPPGETDAYYKTVGEIAGRCNASSWNADSDITVIPLVEGNWSDGVLCSLMAVAPHTDTGSDVTYHKGIVVSASYDMGDGDAYITLAIEHAQTVQFDESANKATATAGAMYTIKK